MERARRQYLDGDAWSFKPFYGEDWSWRNAHKPETRDVLGWHRGIVPGSVQHDLVQNGLAPDPYFETNSLLLEWAPERTWVYKRWFTPEPDWQGRRVRLVFEGVDYAARFYLNGELLGAHEGMFVPVKFEVGERLKFGEENLLAVVVDPAPQEQPQVGYTSRVRMHKSRMGYWWDFCPRMIHLGIWDRVYLEASGGVRVEDVWVRTELEEEGKDARLRIAIKVDTDRSRTAWIEIALSDNGGEIGRDSLERELVQGENHVEMRLQVDKPQLWWPNGSGEQPLYYLDLRIATMKESEGNIIHISSGIKLETESTDEFETEWELSDSLFIDVGLRKLEFIPNEGATQETLPYTLQVNGRRIYIQGWNWVPMDALYGVERPEKLERLLILAKRAGVNMLRVWGGGLIEKEAFYSLCDRLGILVWQEFIQSSSGIDNTPADDPEFIEWMADQARQIIPRRRNHASLAIWCGGNELQTPEGRPLDDRHPLLGALREVVEEMDPERTWLPTSPSGPVFGNTLEAIHARPRELHDVHGPWEFQGLEAQYNLFKQGTSLLHSEFGVEGITNQKTLDRTISPEHQAPVSLENPLWRHLGAWWVKEKMWKEVFGEASSVRELVRAVQYLQAAGLGYAVEANRRRAYRNSGSLPWQFNEPYPMAACTSAVDYYTRPKPAYEAVRRAYLPLRILASYPTQAWAGRERLDFQIWISSWLMESIPEAYLDMEVRGASGKLYATRQVQVPVPINGSEHLLDWAPTLPDADEELFFLDLHLSGPVNQTLDHARTLHSRTENLAPMLHAPETSLNWQVQLDGEDRWLLSLTNRGDWTVLYLWLEDARPVESEGGVFFEDNYFCLFPGESRTLKVEWHSVPPTERELEGSAFNLKPIRIHAR